MSNPGLLFWRRYVHRPLGVGGVAPSGSALARAMVETLAPGAREVVVEIGPGTGPFTRALLEAGVEPSRLVLIELDAEFVRHLRQRFPGVTVRQGDASQLPQLLREEGHDKVPKILSGLPLRSMPDAVRAAIGSPAALPPTLIVHHRHDRCHVTPPGAVEPFKAWGGAKVRVVWMDGGVNAGHSCRANAYHGFNGLDGNVVATIARFVTGL